MNRLLISLNPFRLNACINSFTCLRASIYKSIWNTITASIAAFRFPSYPPVIIEQIDSEEKEPEMFGEEPNRVNKNHTCPQSLATQKHQPELPYPERLAVSKQPLKLSLTC